MKRESQLIKERKIRQRYAFFVKAKDDALKSLIQIGKKWGIFRYAMMVFLFIFLLTYHVSYNLLIKCKVHDKVARAIAYSMVVVMIFTSINLTALAMETDPYAVQPAAVSGGYETLTIDPSALNGSTIYGSGDSEFGLDRDGGFYSSAWRSSGCLPDSGSITVGSVPYQFTWTGSAPYAGKDSIRLSSASPVNTTSKTMVLKQYGVYDEIYILGTAAGFANADSTLSFTVDLYYTEGDSTQTTYTLGDWYRDAAVDNKITLYTGLYRKDVNYSASQPNGYLVKGHGPRLQSMAIDCDETRLLSSIKFTMNTQTQSSGGTTYYLYSGIYAVTGKVSDNAPATPVLHEVTDADLTSKSFIARWDSANNATKYYLDVATDASFANMLPGYNNKDVGNVTEYKVEGLTEGATYYYRVRSANNAGQSLSSTVRTAVPAFKNLPTPELSYENTVVVGEATHLQSVSWPVFAPVENYRWTVEVTTANGVVSTCSGDLNRTASEDSAYVVADGEKYRLDITNLVDSVGTYKVSVIADPAADSDEYLTSDTAVKTVDIVYPDVTVDVTDELKASGIVSGIGGDCEKSVTDGVVTLTAKNANAYSELGTWYKSGEVFDTGVSASLTADIQYVDNYVLIFDINRNKLELVDDGNGSYTLKLLEDIALEQDLVFGEDIILDLNGKNITADADAGFEVDDVILNIRNGELTDATGGTGVIINTIANGAVIVERSAAVNGLVGGDAEVSWSESNGDIHYATMNDALTEGGSKAAEDNSTLSLIQDTELTEDVIIPESITIHIPEGKELSVAENVTLTNGGSIVTDGAITNAGRIQNTAAANWKNEGVVANTTTGEIYNEGSMDNASGRIDNVGLFVGDGVIANENGVITSTEGIIQNQIDNGENGQIVSEASWNEEGKKYYGPINAAFDSAANNTDEEVTITVEDNISLEENVTVPEHVTLEIPENKTLTVPEGVVLDNDGEIVESGTLQVNGDLQTDASWTDGQTNHYSDLETALDKVEAGESVTLLEDITWTEDETLEIPQDVDFVIPNDVVLEIEEEKVVNSENIKSETSWKSDASSNKVSFGSLKEAIEESASNEENNVDILIRDNVVVEEDLVIPGNANVKIPEDASLTIPENVVVENNGSVEVEGDFNKEGTFNTEATWKDGESDFYGTFDEAMDVVNAEDSNVTDVTIVGDVVLKEDVVIPEGANVAINEGANLTVPDGKEIENNGNITNNGTLTNNGNISNNREIINAGVVDGDGSVANGDLSRIDTNDGIIKNKITDENGEPDDSMIESETVVTDPETGEKYYGSLEAVLENAEAGDEVQLKKDEVVLEKDLEIPEDVTLMIPEDATLTVPEGVALENNGLVVNDSESGIVINDGSAINNGTIIGEGTIVNNDGSLDLTEGVTNNAVESTPNGTVKSEAAWTIDGETYRGSLEKALEAVSNSGGGNVVIDAPELNLEESITIPEGVALIVPEDTVVTVKDGAIVDNNGKIVSNGEIKTEGTGKVDSDAGWSDVQGKTTYGSIEELLEEMSPDENGESGVTNVTILGDNVTLPADREEIVIPDGVKFEVKDGANLVIPEETELVNKGELLINGEIGGDGSIDNSAGTIEMGNGAIKSEIAEGKEGTLKDLVLVETGDGNYYTSLEEAVKDPNANEVTVKGEVSLKENVAIPEDVTLMIPEDATLTVPEGTTLENNGLVVNDSENGIVIKEGSAINNGTILGDGTIVNNDGSLDLTEGITGNTVESTPNSTVKSEATWTIDGETYRGSLEKALEAVSNSGGGNVVIDAPELNLEESITIPEGVALIVPEDTVVTIKDGATIENNGKIASNGEIKTEGTGKIDTDASWTDENGKETYGSIEEALEAMQPDENGESGVTDVTIMGDNVTLPADREEIVIPEGVKFEVKDGANLVIPEETELVNKGELLINGEIGGNGSIDNSAGTIEMGNGAIKSEIAEGKEGTLKDLVLVETEDGNYYTSLKEAVKDPNANEVTVKGDVSLKENVVIPEDVTLMIPEDATLTVPEGTTLENNGLVVNDSENGIVIKEGSAINNGTILGDGTIVNNDGSLDLTEGITGNTVESTPNSTVKSEATWTIDGETYRGSLEKALEEVANNGGGSVIIDTPELNLEDSVTIPEGVTLVVPEDTVVTIKDGATIENNGKIASNGEIKTEGTGKIDTDASWTDENGKETYGSIEEALEAMQPDENGESGVTDVTIMGDNVTLPADREEIVIPEGVKFEVKDGANLVIPEETELVNKGDLLVNGEVSGTGTIDNTDGTIRTENGTIDAEFGEGKEGSLKDLVLVETGDGNYFTSLEEAVKDSNANEVIVMGDVSLKENVVIPEDVTLIIPEDATLTVPEGTTLENNGLVVNDSENGIVIKEGSAINNGTILGDGTIVNNDGSLDLTEGITGNKVESTENGIVKSEALWVINGEIYRGSLEKALEEVTNNGGGSVIIDTPELNLEDSVTIPEGVTLVVPEDTVVTIKDGATIENNGKIASNGEIKTEGTGKIDTDASWTDENGKETYGSIEEALEAMQPDENGESGVTDVTIMGDNVTLPADREEIVIPEGVKFEVKDGANLVIPEETELVNKGELLINGEIGGDGSIDNSAGTIDMGNGAIKSEIAEGKEGTLKDLVLVETGDGSYYTSLEEALKDPNANKVTVMVDTSLEESVVIPETVTLVIPEGTKLTVTQNGSLLNDGTIKNDGEITNDGNITGDGAINNDNGTINSVNGVVSNVIENGENGKVIADASWEVDGVPTYGSLEKAIESAQRQETDAIEINNNIIITSTVEIPEGVTLEIKPGVAVIVEKGAILTNKGTIVNNGTLGTDGIFTNDGNVEGNGAIVDLTQHNKPSEDESSEEKPSEEKPAGDKPTDDTTVEDEASEDETSEDETSEDETAEDGSSEEEPTENEPSDDKPADDGADTGNADVGSDIMPEEPEENADAETEEYVKGVIEDETVSDEEQVEIETRIKEVDEAKKETQITTTDVNFEEAKTENVTQDRNVAYGQGEIKIVIDTLDEQGSFDQGMYESIILSEVETVVNACLTEEEKANVESGAAAQIRLVIQVSPQKVSKEDMAKAEETVLQMQEEIPGLTIAGHLDVSVEKNIEGQNWKKVSKLGEEIEIKFEIPTEMQVNNATYRVLRVHNGEATLLDDLDDDEKTITIRTNLFSTYSIVYEKEETGPNFMLISLLILLIIALMVVWFESNRRKKIKGMNS